MRTIQNILKYIGWIILSILLLVGLLVAILQVKPVKDIVFGKVVEELNKSLNAELSAKLEGNFINSLVIEDIQLKNEKETIFSAEALELRYNLFGLLKKQIIVSEIKLRKPELVLTQEPDSVWSLANLMKKDTNSGSGEINRSFDWTVRVEMFELLNGQINTETYYKQVPKTVDSLYILARLEYQAQNLDFELKSARLNTFEPKLLLKNLSLHAQQNDSVFVLKDLQLETAENKIQTNGSVARNIKSSSHLFLSADSLETKEFQAFTGYFFPARPSLVLNGSMQGQTASINLIIKEQNQAFSIGADTPNLNALLNNEEEEAFHYQISILFEKFDISSFLEQRFPATNINGLVKLNTEGLDIQNNTAKIRGEFHKSSYDQILVDSLSFNLNKRQDSLWLETKSRNEYGQMQLNASLDRLFGDITHSIHLAVEDLDLAPIMIDSFYTSDLNFKIDWEGHGTQQAEAELIKLTASHSLFNNLQLDTLNVLMDYSNNRFGIRKMNGRTLGLDFDGQGFYHLKASSNIQLKADLYNLNDLNTFYPEYPVDAKGKLQADITGYYDNLKTNIQAQLEFFRYDSLRFHDIAIEGKGRLKGVDYGIVGELATAYAGYDDPIIDSLRLRYGLFTDSINLEGNLSNQDAAVNLDASVVWDDTSKINLRSLSLDALDKQWTLTSEPTEIFFTTSTLRFPGFRLSTKDGGKDQSINIYGVLDTKKRSTLKISTKDLDIEPLIALYDTAYQTHGFLDANLSFQYDSVFPAFESNFVLKNASYEHINFQQFQTTLSLDSGVFNIQTELKPDFRGEILFEGSTPLPFIKEKQTFRIGNKQSVSGSLIIDSLEIQPLTGTGEYYQSSGTIDAKLNLMGTFEQPKLDGRFFVRNGTLTLPAYGIDYKNILVAIKAKGDSLFLDQMTMNSEDGILQADGQFVFKQSFVQYEDFVANLQLSLDNFQPVNHKQFNAKVNGATQLSSKPGRMNYEGELTIVQADLVLPAILNLMGETSPPNLEEPLLIKEIKKQTQTEGNQEAPELSLIDENEWNHWIDSLQGSIKIIIPDNTWIKKKGMHIELDGDVQVVKYNPYFEIFGTINVKRGEYDLLGRTFRIEEGQLVFQGGEDMLPLMNIAAIYKFRDANQLKQELRVNIQGKADKPEISFTLNEESINEGDALSYLVFGKHPNQLSLQQQKEVSESSTLNMATKAASSLLSSQLTKLLGEQLNVDYIEISGNEDLTGGNLSVGTYLTNDLFIRYDQYFGEVNEKDIDKYEISLEYELFKSLFLQLNNSSSESGFDVIIRSRQ